MTSARIEHIETAALKPYERNARTHSPKQIEQIAASITEFGFTNPVLISKDNEIIAGHGRVLGAQKLNMHSVPCVRLSHLTDTQRRAYVIADNKIALNAEWDDALLGSELLDLKSLDVDLSLLGVDEHEFNAMMERAGREGIDEDDVPELKPEAFSRRGDVWLLGDHRLMCGDSTSAEDAKHLMAGATAEMLFTSPPYSDMRDYEGDDCSIGKIVRFIPTFNPYCRYIVFNLGIKRHEHGIVQYWDDFITAAKSTGKIFLSWNVWHKSNTSIGQSSAFISIDHEWLFVFGDAAKRINLTEEKLTLSTSASKNRRQKDGSMKRSTSGPSGELKKMGSVFASAPELGPVRSSHPAVFPVALPSQYIRAMTNPNEIVVDPFAGSGTTLIAAEQLGRRCYAMEISPQYIDVAVRRWQDVTGKRARRESDGAEIPDA